MDTRPCIIVAAELAAEGLSICAIARQLGPHRETIGLWLKAIRIEGLSAFLGRHHYHLETQAWIGMIWWRTIPCHSAAHYLNSTSQLSSSAGRYLRGPSLYGQ